MVRALVAGCGYVGSALAAKLAGDGQEVWGLRRTPDAVPPGVRALTADLGRPSTLADLPGPFDVVFYTAAAKRQDEDAYRRVYVEGLCHLLDALAQQGQAPKRILFTSSTSVYRQSDGEWVDEASPTEPQSFQGRTLLEAEARLGAGPFPATVLRLGGIYGPGRRRLFDSVRRGEARCPSGPPLFTNRIHRDDCAGALRHLASLPAPDALYLGVDREPAELASVYRWLSEALGQPPPAATDERPTRASKRCRSDLLVETGYNFLYPTFREGYRELVEDALRGAGTP